MVRMDAADPGSVARDDEPGVLGRLPTTRPQHRSARRGATPTKAAATASTATARPKRPAPAPRAAAPKTTRERTPAPVAPAPPPAPRSGWATPEPARRPTAPMPPLVALADGAARAGAQVLRGVLRRLPGF
jgi:hypothetical protein